MAIAFDYAAAQYVFASSNTLGMTIGSAKERIVLASICWCPNGATLSSVTFGGMAMTLYGTRAQASAGAFTFETYAYYFIGPAVGANNIVVTASAARNIYVAGASYSGVQQVNPFLAAAGVTSGVGISALTLAVTSQVGHLVADFLGIGSDGGGGAAVVGAGQTSRNYNAAAVGGGSTGGGQSEEAGAAAVTMSWTESTANAAYMLISGSLIPANAPRGRAVAYTDDLASDDRRLLDANGVRLQPWEIRADAWVRYAGWAPVTSVVYDSLVDDPTCGYIEDVSWDSDSDVATTTTSRMDMGEIIIARASAQSAG